LKSLTFSVDFKRISSCSSNIRMVRGFDSANDVARNCWWRKGEARDCDGIGISNWLELYLKK